MKYLIISLLALSPLLVFAQGSRGDGVTIGKTLGKIIDQAIDFINVYLIPLIFAVAFVAFIIGIFQYFFTGGEEGRKKGKDYIIWGVIAFFVMVSVWGIVNLIDRTFQLDDSTPDLPYVPTSSGSGGSGDARNGGAPNTGGGGEPETSGGNDPRFYDI